MSDTDKTKEQLIAELEALRHRTEALESALQREESQEAMPVVGAEPPREALSSETSPADAGTDITKRELLKTSWVAPLILTVSLPSYAFAQSPTPFFIPTPGPGGPPPT